MKRNRAQLQPVLLLLLGFECSHTVAAVLRGRSLSTLQFQTGRALQDVSDKLGGILDAVEQSYAEVKTGLSDFDAGCDTQVTSVTTRKLTQQAAMSDLENDRIRFASQKAVAEAEMSHLAEEESSTLSSYNSAVLRRATERQAYMDDHSTNEQQTQVLKTVLDNLQAKQSEVSAMASSASESKVTDHTEGGQLGEIIGIFTHMHESTEEDMAEATSKAVDGDADLKALVSTYKDSLSHVNEQYELKLADKVKHDTDLLAAQEEHTLRSTLAGYDEQTGDLLTGLCGSAGKAPLLAADGDKLADNFRTQINLALTTLQEEIDGSTTFLQSSRKARSPAGGKAAVAPVSSSVNVTPNQGANASSAASVALVGKAAAVTEYNKTKKSDNSPAVECAEDKQSLTAQLLAARQNVRVANGNLQATEERVTELGQWVELAGSQETELTNTRSALTTAWTPLGNNIQANTFESVLADASTELSSVETEVNTYSVSIDATPRAAAIVKAVEAVSSTLKSIQALPLASLATAYAEMQIATAAFVTAAGNKKQDLTIQKSAAEGTVSTQQSGITSMEGEVTSLTDQLAAVDQRCETELYGATQLIAVKSKVGLTAVRAALRRGGFAQSKKLSAKQRVSADEQAKAWGYARHLLG